MSDVHRVFRAACAPSKTLRSWVKGTTVVVISSWIVLSLACAVGFARSGHNLASWSLPSGWFALCACVGTWAALAWDGLAPSIMLGGPVAALVAVLAAGGFLPALEALDRLGLPMHFSLVLCLLATLAIRHRRLSTPLPEAPSKTNRDRPGVRVTRAVRAQASRWTPLIDATPPFESKRLALPWAMLPGTLYISSLVYYFTLRADPTFVLSWVSLARILTATVILWRLLSLRDAHWRRLLAPGRAFRRYLGWRIFESTAMLVLLSWIVIALLAWVAIVVMGAELEPLLRSASRFYPIALEWLLAIQVAVVLHGFLDARWPRFARTFVPVMIVVALVLTFVATTFGFYRLSPVSAGGPVRIDPLYVASLVVLTAALVPIANLLWSKRDLAPLTRRTPG